MIKTRATQLFGVKHPIILSGMQWITKAEMVAAVCEAGGFGFISSQSFDSINELRGEIEKCRNLTDKPFGINISMLPDVSAGEKVDEILNLAASEKITMIETSGRSPDLIIQKARILGIKIIHKVASAKHAVSAEKAGVDAVILVGYEAGGHPGMDQVGTFINLPSAISAVNIPVIAAGGMCDGKSLIAALALGAEGIAMGTRFIATKESPVHNVIKDWIIQSKETDTIIVQRTIKNAIRCIKNDQSYKILGMETFGSSLKELLPYISGQKGKLAWENGDLNNAILPMGQCIGLINDLPSIAEVLENIIMDAESVIKNLGDLQV